VENDMAKKPISEAGSAAEDEIPAARGEEVPEPAGISPQPPFQAQLDEMRDLVRALVSSVQEARAQTARTEIVREALQEVKADVRAASQAMMMAPAVSGAANAAPSDYANPHGVREGKCGPCECVDEGCCCFDIMVSWVRATKPQIEPADMGDIGPFINAMEMQFYFTVGGTGFLWPGLGSTMDLRADGLPGGPGLRVSIERPVKRICFPKGTTINVLFETDCVEMDAGIERPAGMKDEYGTGSSVITLDCCMERIYPALPVDINLIYGGEGRGMVQVGFYAQRVCC
jgi:hypothetical protein